MQAIQEAQIRIIPERDIMRVVVPELETILQEPQLWPSLLASDGISHFSPQLNKLLSSVAFIRLKQNILETLDLDEAQRFYEVVYKPWREVFHALTIEMAIDHFFFQQEYPNVTFSPSIIPIKREKKALPNRAMAMAKTIQTQEGRVIDKTVIDDMAKLQLALREDFKQCHIDVMRAIEKLPNNHPLKILYQNVRLVYEQGIYRGVEGTLIGKSFEQVMTRPIAGLNSLETLVIDVLGELRLAGQIAKDPIALANNLYNSIAIAQNLSPLHLQIFTAIKKKLFVQNDRNERESGTKFIPDLVQRKDGRAQFNKQLLQEKVLEALADLMQPTDNGKQVGERILLQLGCPALARRADAQIPNAIARMWQYECDLLHTMLAPKNA